MSWKTFWIIVAVSVVYGIAATIAKAEAQAPQRGGLFPFPVTMNCVGRGEFRTDMEKEKMSQVWEEINSNGTHRIAKYENDEGVIVVWEPATTPITCVLIGRLKDGDNS